MTRPRGGGKEVSNLKGKAQGHGKENGKKAFESLVVPTKEMMVARTGERIPTHEEKD